MRQYSVLVNLLFYITIRKKAVKTKYPATLTFTKKYFMKDAKQVSGLLANEQTFLAWLRTGVEVMAFGFVAVKFSLFASQVMGIILVALGALMICFSYFRYRSTVRQIRDKQYAYSTFMLTVTASAILVISALLLAYLIEAYLKPASENPSVEKRKSEKVASQF